MISAQVGSNDISGVGELGRPQVKSNRVIPNEGRIKSIDRETIGYYSRENDRTLNGEARVS